MRSGQNITSVFNIPQIENEEIDYKRLYDNEKKMRVFYEHKTKQLQGKLQAYVRDSPHLFGKHKQPDIYEIMEDIRSFKSMLPNSIKEIAIPISDDHIHHQTSPPLVKQWAIYGINEQELHQFAENRNHEGQIVSSNNEPSQIVQHSAKLVFPSGTNVKKLSGKIAFEYSLDIINLSKEKLKSFILTFQPTCFLKKASKNDNGQAKNKDKIIDILNPDKKVFAVCMEVQEFTLMKQNEKAQQKTPNKGKEKTVKFQLSSYIQSQDLSIIISKRIYCIFTYYPFFSFFEELLRNLLYAVKVERYIQFKQNGENLKLVDSKTHTLLMKNQLQELRRQCSNKPIVLDKVLDFSLSGNNKAYLQLNRDALIFYKTEEWAYSILSLFTLDVFLDVFTLLVLQEKMVFVCSNPTILTYAIFLFTKVLIKPFQYPYPVVTLIPDQQQYLNAPFPVVYGYLKNINEVRSAQIIKRFKNVYILFKPTGVQIESDDKTKILRKKSPKLRDKLLLKFKKMNKHLPPSIFSRFFQDKSPKSEFQYPINLELAHEIISEVYNYIEKDIYRLLPTEDEVQAIKNGLLNNKHIEEDEIDRQISLKIKEQYKHKSKDPFYKAFLQTQLLNVHIFKY